MQDWSFLPQRAGMSRPALAALLGVSERTLERYRLSGQAPPAARALLGILVEGRMPWPGFERLVVYRGAIYHESAREGLPVEAIPGYVYKLKELDAVYRQLGAARAELARYQAAPAQYLLDL